METDKYLEDENREQQEHFINHPERVTGETGMAALDVRNAADAIRFSMFGKGKDKDKEHTKDELGK